MNANDNIIMLDDDYYRDNIPEEAYSDYLDEVEDDIDIHGYSFKVSSIIKNLDPIAFRCEYLDWLNFMSTDDLKTTYEKYKNR